MKKKSTFGENGKIAVRSSKRQTSSAGEENVHKWLMFMVSLLQDPALKALTIRGKILCISLSLYPFQKCGIFCTCISVYSLHFMLFQCFHPLKTSSPNAWGRPSAGISSLCWEVKDCRGRNVVWLPDAGRVPRSGVAFASSPWRLQQPELLQSASRDLCSLELSCNQHLPQPWPWYTEMTLEWRTFSFSLSPLFFLQCV